MVTPGPTHVPAILCIVLLLSGTLAGCTDKDRGEDQEPVGNPFVRAEPTEADPDTIQEYIRYYRERAPEDCQGCISLDADAEQPDPATTVEPVEGVTLAAPAPGDHIEVSGVQREASGPGYGGLPIPHVDGSYRFDVVFDFLFQGAPLFSTPGTYAQFRFVYGDGTYPVDAAAFTPHVAKAFVDTRTRSVVALESDGVSVHHADAQLGIDGSADYADATHRLQPEAANLFWLGSHLWGRTWFEGDSLEFAWTPPGTEEPALWFDYTVTKAETVESAPVSDDEGTPYPHSHPEPRTQLTVRVAVHDHFGKERKWELRFDGTSPYPYYLRLTRDTHASVEPSLVPPELVVQTIRTVKRGDNPLAWPQEIQNTATIPARWGDATFRLDERVASPVLDTLPAYPLRDAMSDLTRLEPTFADWWGSRLDALLVDARLEPRLVYGGTDAVVEYEWRLTFLDRGDVRTWVVARPAATSDVVVPVAHRAGTGTGADLPSSLRFMDPGDHFTTRLSAGDGVAVALEHAQVQGVVDRAHYTLTHTHQEGLGGSLLVGHAHMPDPPEPIGGRYPGGYVVQDLVTGAIVESLVFDV